jgi:hypothetical protein
VIRLKLWGLFRPVDDGIELATGTARNSARDARRIRRQHPDCRVMRYGLTYDGKAVRIDRALGVVFMPEETYSALFGE